MSCHSNSYIVCIGGIIIKTSKNNKIIYVAVCVTIFILIGITAKDIYNAVYNKNNESITRVPIIPKNYKTQASVHGISYSYPDEMTVFNTTEEYEGKNVDIEVVGHQTETEFIAEFMVYPMDSNLNMGFKYPFLINNFGRFIPDVDGAKIEEINRMNVMKLDVNQEGIQSTYLIQDNNKNIIAFSFLEKENMDYADRDLLIRNVLGSIEL